MGGGPWTDAAIASWAPGRFDLFYVVSGTLKHRWFQNTWSAEEDLGGNHLNSSPNAVAWGPNRLDVFVRGDDGAGNANALLHLFFAGAWSGWESLGGTLTSSPGVASWAPGRLDVFYRNSSNALGHVWFAGTWHAHEQLGSDAIFGTPNAVSWGPNRLDVFARTATAGGPLLHKAFAGTWSAWENLGGSVYSAPAVASSARDRLDVFYLGADSGLRSKAFNVSWQPEASIAGGGPYAGSPTAISWGAERLDVFLKAAGTIVQRTWLPPQTRDVLTQHNDAWRSGAVLTETALTPASVASSAFGLLYRRAVVGKVYAQPLYAENVWIPSAGLGSYRNVLYAATLENNIYAFDADSTGTTAGATLWQRVGDGTSFDAPANNDNNQNFGDAHDPHLGIVSTPVISRANNTLYLVDAEKIDATHKRFRLHALDLAFGIDKVPAVTVGDSALDPITLATVTFDPNQHQQRPALLLANGLIYVAFGSSMDRTPYHGWVFAYRADTLARAAGYCTTSGPTRMGGGIWQSGNGLAADERGSIYFMTGNGMRPETLAGRTTPERQEESFVRLDGTTLAVKNQYAPHQTPSEFLSMETYDTDLGSGGVMLVPFQDAAIGGGKPGKLYVLDRALGERQAPFQAFRNTWQPAVPTTNYASDPGLAPNIHGSPVYWATADASRSLFYAWSEKDQLKSFSFDRRSLVSGGAVVLAPVASRDHSMPGGILSLSANGSTAHSGVVWAVIEEPVDTCAAPPDETRSCSTVDTCDAMCFTMPGHFYAFDAETLTRLFDARVPRYSKFTPPTIARGKVVLGTSNNELVVYGLH